MERNKRTIFAVLIAAIIVVAVFSSFAVNLFSTADHQIRLPDLSDSADSDPAGSDETADNEVIRVEVTPRTVQSIIATLTRSRSYHREISIELWAGEEEPNVTTAEVWVDGGWTRTSITASGGRVQHNLVGEDQHWLWYEGDLSAVSLPVGTAAADLVQRIPTYEDVLELPQQEITDTGYEKYDGAVCIYVEVELAELASRERYWISVSDGLLVAAQRVRDGELVYRMQALSTEIPAPLDSSFALPGGQVLHTVGDS